MENLSQQDIDYINNPFTFEDKIYIRSIKESPINIIGATKIYYNIKITKWIINDLYD